ncbi:MAG: transposase [bacterium]|nr:transposase [bacterium]
MAIIHDDKDDRIPAVARDALGFLVNQLHGVKEQITTLEKKLKAWHKNNEASRRLETIPGIGVITATALVATIGDASQFKSGRELAAWLGLVNFASMSAKVTRVYFVKKGDEIIILLCGGNKSSQDKDIKIAKKMAKEL